MEPDPVESSQPPPSRWVRRLLVVAWVLSLALIMGITWVGLAAWVQLLGLLAVIVTSLGLRAATRGPALPGFRSSYLLVVTLVLTALAAGWIAADADQVRWQPTADQILALLFGFAGLVAALPSAIQAWGEGGEGRGRDRA